MWMMPLHLNVNQKSNYDDMMVAAISNSLVFFSWKNSLQNVPCYWFLQTLEVVKLCDVNERITCADS